MDQLKKVTGLPRAVMIAAIVAVLAAVLYFISSFNYLLFHTSAELFSIVIAFGLFTIAWNARTYSEHGYLIHLGTAFLFIAFLDLLHTLSYKGISIFSGPNDYATELWIAARYIESLTLLVLVLLAKRRPDRRRFAATMLLYGAVTAGVIVSVFILEIFPRCFVEGSGLTPFKKGSEYIISFILAASGVVIYLRRLSFEVRVYRFLLWSIVLTILSELSFTFYIDVYGLSNFIGHLLKIGSFYLIYKAIIETAFKKPVNLLFQKLAKSNQEKDRLFSIIAHDLKNPFSGIESSSQLLLNEFDDMPDEEKKEFLVLIRKSARLATRLLDNLLLWARLQTGRMKAEPVNCRLQDIVSENMELYMNNARQKDVILYNNIPEGFTVFADRVMINLVVRNLLSNAIKFTAAGGAIYFEVPFPSCVHGAAASFSVRDTGRGIPPALLDTLFVLHEGSSALGTNGEEGSGLGLVLCKEFLDHNNGTISVRSAPGEGSTFTVTLPVAP
jgi:signal transduction histidine kinase